MLREGTDANAADFAPAPHLNDIPELVQRTSDRAQLSISGTAPRVSKAVELTVYRVAQEALTNFLKHAGPEATAQVDIGYGAAEITIDVIDNGPPVPPSEPHSPGHGLRGMQERVASMGGRLETGPLDGGGFQVRASLPIEQE